MILISVTIGIVAPNVRNGFMKLVLRLVVHTKEQFLRVMLATVGLVLKNTRSRPRSSWARLA